MEITIRPCGAQDAAALTLVAQATFLQTYAETIPLADILAHCADNLGEALHAEWLARPGHSFWLAEIAGTGAPVGYAMSCPPDLQIPTEPGDIELRRIYLLHRFHGGGAGGRLLDAVIRAAREGGFKRLLLSVFGENPNAIAFYARQGFTQAGVRKFWIGPNDYDDLVLALDLDPTS